MKTLTKSDIQFDEIRIIKNEEIDVNTGQTITKWYVNIGYKLLTQEGETFTKDKQIELTGAKLTTVQDFFTKLTTQIKQEEGI